MRTADNSIGWDVEMHTNYGWMPTTPTPHETREQAKAAKTDLASALPGEEFRVYEAVRGRA